MATSAELRSGFDDIEYHFDGDLKNEASAGDHAVLDEFRGDLGAFEPEPAERRAAPPIAGPHAAVTGFRAPVAAAPPHESRQWMLLIALAVGLVATGVGAAGAWVAMQPGGLPILPSAPAAWISPDGRALPRIAAPEAAAVAPEARGGAAPEARRGAAPEAPVVAEAPAVRPATPPAAPVVPAATVAAPAASPAPGVSAVERAAVDATLANVSLAYRSLDASALARDWPGADVEKLSSEFAGLKYQSLSFDRCAVRPAEAGRMVASCGVSRAMAPKSGDLALQRRQETWTILLSRAGDRYVIAGVSAR